MLSSILGALKEEILRNITSSEKLPKILGVLDQICFGALSISSRARGTSDVGLVEAPRVPHLLTANSPRTGPAPQTMKLGEAGERWGLWLLDRGRTLDESPLNMQHWGSPRKLEIYLTPAFCLHLHTPSYVT